MKPVVVIMAGGSGARLWPASRTTRSKHSLTLFGKQSLLQSTIRRITSITDTLIIITTRAQRTEIENSVQGDVTVLYEPVGRNTAPCVLLAAEFVKKSYGPHVPMFVLPADQHIADTEAFLNTVRQGLDYLETHPDEIGTVGITPTRPETGFGYIKLSHQLTNNIHRIESFVEKPDKERAQQYLATGNHLWNGGMFLFTAQTMITLFQRLQPKIAAGISALSSFEHISREQYESIPAISFDYAIMERTDTPIFTVPADCGWSDVGSWFAYWELLPKDENGNSANGPATFVECHNCMVFNMTQTPTILFKETERLLVVLPDALFSASLRDHQQVKIVVDQLTSLGLERLQ